jgi:hypothetical protein
VTKLLTEAKQALFSAIEPDMNELQGLVAQVAEGSPPSQSPPSAEGAAGSGAAASADAGGAAAPADAGGAAAPADAAGGAPKFARKRETAKNVITGGFGLFAGGVAPPPAAVAAAAREPATTRDVEAEMDAMRAELLRKEALSGAAAGSAAGPSNSAGGEGRNLLGEMYQAEADAERALLKPAVAKQPKQGAKKPAGAKRKKPSAGYRTASQLRNDRIVAENRKQAKRHRYKCARWAPLAQALDHQGPD